MHQPIEIIPAIEGKEMTQKEAKINPVKRLYRRINRLAERSSRRFSVVAVWRCHPRTMLLAVAISGLLLTGCKVGPNYSRPAVAAQAGWKEEHSATNTTQLPTEWWQIFGDAELNALETQAAKANQDQ